MTKQKPRGEVIVLLEWCGALTLEEVCSSLRWMEFVMHIRLLFGNNSEKFLGFIERIEGVFRIGRSNSSITNRSSVL